MQGGASSTVRKKQQRQNNDIQRKNAGIKGDEITNMLNVQKNLKQNDQGGQKGYPIAGKDTGPDMDANEHIDEQEYKPLEQFDEAEILERNGWEWPKTGRYATVYKYWMMIWSGWLSFSMVYRIGFETKPSEFIVYSEFLLSFIYLIDMFRIFTTPFFNEHGKKVSKRREIFKNYAFPFSGSGNSNDSLDSSMFIPDLYSFYPLAYMRYKSKYEEGGYNEVQNFLNQNFERMPRFYKIMLILQLGRMRFAMPYFSEFLKNLDVPIGIQSVIRTFIQLVFILVVAGCFWQTASELNLKSNENWITGNGLQDSSNFDKFMAALYWATVTCTTVGYGDILPTNEYELIWAMFIIVIGVAVFSFILSNLSSQFSEITRTNAVNQERIQQIDQLDQKFTIGQDLVEQLTAYFTSNNLELEVETNQEMSYLLKILPSTLKTQLAKFLYNDAIFVHRFLQDRDDNFYSKYLELLKNERFTKGDYICKIGQKPENVYFIMNGVVKNQTTERYFESGQMINHDNIIQKIDIFEDYLAETDVQTLRFEKEVFQQILEQFPDIQEDMQQMVQDKNDQQMNERFVKDAIHNEQTRKIIVKHYNDIVAMEKENMSKTNKTLALRLNHEQKSFQVNEKKKRNPKKKATDSQNEEEESFEQNENGSNSLAFDQSIEDESPRSKNHKSVKNQRLGKISAHGDDETPRKNRKMNKNITKVKDLLRESQENALNMNKDDLDGLFNMEIETQASMDDVSRQYCERIQRIREQQKHLLPLFLQSKRVVARHKRCLKVILQENEQNIPYQLQRTIDKGHEGLNGYGKLLENIETILKKNNDLTEQLQKYQMKIKSVASKTASTESGIQSLKGDVTQNATVLKKIENSKGRIQDLLAGMYTNLDEQKEDDF